MKGFIKTVIASILSMRQTAIIKVSNKFQFIKPNGDFKKL
jgi:hypothetical protein